jgi:hypothetical protein
LSGVMACLVGVGQTAHERRFLTIVSSLCGLTDLVDD